MLAIALPIQLPACDLGKQLRMTESVRTLEPHGRSWKKLINSGFGLAHLWLLYLLLQLKHLETRTSNCFPNDHTLNKMSNIFFKFIPRSYFSCLFLVLDFISSTSLLKQMGMLETYWRFSGGKSERTKSIWEDIQIHSN